MVFRPDGKFAYVINEINSTVTALAYDPQAGALKEAQTISTLPGYYDGRTVAPRWHPSFGEVSVRVESGEQYGGAVRRGCGEGHSGIHRGAGDRGKTPRHFGIEPSAKHMVIANQDSDTLLACRIDSGNGRLKPSGIFAESPMPVCAKFLPPG